MAPIPSTANQASAVEALTCRNGYSPASGIYDEMRLPNGSMRPHWKTFFDSLQNISCEELQRRNAEALLFLKENGSTYNIHGEGSDATWAETLDPIPYIIQKDDWTGLESALRQRMRLLKRIFHDLYGPCTLLEKGLIPPEIIFGHRDYLISCSHTDRARPPDLLFCGFDVARDADGCWRVLRHLVKAPEALGYALQDRTAMAKVFPEIIRDCKVYRLSHFFRALRSGLANLLPGLGRYPRIVILTPGSSHGAYFEHAYLSAYLGYPLVQGGDLTVRDASVWLKSIGGLERVDIVLRFVDDALCDPLELAAGSIEGTPGLTESVRRGNVSVANPLGSGLLDSLALSAHLPDLSRHLLNEELLLPGPSTLWCGNPEFLSQARRAPERYRWIELQRGREIRSFAWETLKGEQRSQLQNRILSSPNDFIAMEKIAFASTPSLKGLSLVPRQAVIRVFAIAHQDDFLVMPGGLARYSGRSSHEAHAYTTDAGGKDVWVLSPEPQKHVSLWLRPDQMEQDLRSNSILTSCAAENLFWVGRYAERAEGLARLLRTVLYHYANSSHSEDGSERECLNALLRTLTHITATFPGFVSGAQEVFETLETELLADIRDISRPGSLTSTLGAIMRAAYAVRERWSKDTWRVLDEIDGRCRELQRTKPGGLRSLQQDLDSIITSLMAFSGLGMESMTREQGWLLLDIGRRIERALQLVELFLSLLVDRHAGDNVLDHLVLEATLITTENIITYRRRYRSYLQIETVLELLLLDPTNPRSLGYQLHQLQEHAAELPRDRVPYRLDEDERAILEASSLIRLSDPKWLTQSNDAGRYARLEELLTSVKTFLLSTSNELSKTYFSHVQKSQQLGLSSIEQTP